MENTEQLQLDTRSELEVAIQREGYDAIKEIKRMIVGCPEVKSTAKNRHEAYGVAADCYVQIEKLHKKLKNDLGSLLATLSDPKYNAVEAMSVITNDTAKLALIAMTAAATTALVLDDLFNNDNTQTLFDETADDDTEGFQEAN